MQARRVSSMIASGAARQHVAQAGRARAGMRAALSHHQRQPLSTVSSHPNHCARHTSQLRTRTPRAPFTSVRTAESLDDVEVFYDELGPERVVHLHDPKIGMRAYVVVDSTAAGVAVGGVRMVNDVTADETIRLARSMTLKNVMAGLPHGGAKAGIVADAKVPVERKEALVRSFARSIKHMTDFVPGPDMGMGETTMAWINDEIGRGVGLPRVLGGVPAREMGCTGFGVARAAATARQIVDSSSQGSLKGVRFAIEGFGNVGRSTAAHVVDAGGIVVGLSDTKGAIYSADGLDVAEAIKAKRRHGTVQGYSLAHQVVEPSSFVGVSCDVLVPAARPDCINESNWRSVEASIVVPGSNSPMSDEVEQRLHERNVLVVPDFISNAGGVICAALELHGTLGGGDGSKALEEIDVRVSENTRLVLKNAAETGASPRVAAVELAKQRILQALSYRSNFLTTRSRRDLFKL